MYYCFIELVCKIQGTRLIVGRESPNNYTVTLPIRNREHNSSNFCVCNSVEIDMY